MDFKAFMRGHEQTQIHLHTAIMGASGWKVGQANASLLGKPAVFVYLYDLRTNFTWMANVPRDEFVRMSRMSSNDGVLKQPLRNALGSLLFDVSKGSPPAPVEGVDWETMLAYLLISYAGTTNTWQQANSMREGGHFVVLNYRKNASVTNSRLRPFVLSDTNNTALTTLDLQNYIAQVIEIDSARHPEWFK